jgi:hypothetical protein
VKTRQTILFVANVGEEGLGDLNGVRYIFKESPYRDRLQSAIVPAFVQNIMIARDAGSNLLAGTEGS